MNQYVHKISELFRTNINPQNASFMAKYMKNKFPFLGIKTPLRKELLKQFDKENGLPSIEELDEIARQLWQLPEREFQYVAVGLLRHFSKKVEMDFLSLYEFLITEKSWWDSVDGIAVWLVGDFFKHHPMSIQSATDRWMKSENIWLQRTVLLFQLHYKQSTDTRLLEQHILSVAGSTEFFIQKAIGWALREYSKTDAQFVIHFVEHHSLASLSKREALKWLNNRK